MHSKLIDLVKDIYQTEQFIPLHAPLFNGNEQEYVRSTIESTFVSSVGQYVDQFEQQVQEFTGAKRAIATVNGTSALHCALFMSGVKQNDMVITQSLTFVATCNVIHHMGAEPVFVDVSPISFGMCPKSLLNFLQDNAVINDQGECVHKASRKVIRACVPMHTFGHPVDLDKLTSICDEWHIELIEDAAESIGSYYKQIHTGTKTRFAALSFNGNKVITTGGGGMVLCRDAADADRLKHLTTTAKVPHAYEFYHDEAGFNYRMPNLNAALGCAQMESLPDFLSKKRQLAEIYQDFFDGSEWKFVREPEYAKSNYWLNALICPNFDSRNELLTKTNEQGVMTRPIWKLMHHLPMYKECYRSDLSHSEWLEQRVVNIPSSVVSNEK